MKKSVPILVIAVLAITLPHEVSARQRRVVVVEGGTQAIVGPNAVVVAPSFAETVPAGASTFGQTLSTGSGIGEATTRVIVGTGRGGAGISRTGTIAPIAEGRVITTVPAATTTTRIIPGTGTGEMFLTPSGRVMVIGPSIPRATTNLGTIGAGTSTPVGVAPGK